MQPHIAMFTKMKIIVLLLIAVFHSSRCCTERDSENWSLDQDTVAPDYRRDVSGGCEDSDACPAGLFREDGRCKCARYLPDFASCNGTNLLVADCVCATFDLDRNITSLGACTYKCGKSTQKSARGVLHFPVSNDRHELNDSCSFLNRTGALCGQCLPDHYPLAYSFNMTCIPCPHVRWNWFKYIMAAYLPLTAFYVVMLLCYSGISVNSRLTFNRYITYCQTIALPVLSRIAFGSPVISTSAFISTKVSLTIFGIWNLDFFRPFYSDLCLGLGILPTLALDYVVAVYPFFLIIATYFLVNLCDRHYRAVTILCSPFKSLYQWWNKDKETKISYIECFATFFFLSNVRVLSVSFDLLAPTRVYEIQLNATPQYSGLYYAAGVEYFGKEHLPYAILAILVMCTFYFTPLLILGLYPFKIFQNLLHLFPLRWQFAVRTFVDFFHGVYKDGTEPGTCDCRWCALIFYVVRLVYFLLGSMTSNMISFVIVGTMTVGIAIVIAVLQPFKAPFSHQNGSETVHVLLYTFGTFSAVGVYISLLTAPKFYIVFVVITLLAIISPNCYAGILIFRLIFRACKKVATELKVRWRGRRRGYQRLESQVDERACDRIENSGDYPRENLACFTACA